MLDPLCFLLSRDIEVEKQLPGKVNIANLICGVDIVDFADFTLVEDGVESVSRVGGEEVAASVETRAVEDEREALSQKRAELWDDF